MGRTEDSPTVGPHGEVTLEYYNGQSCNSRGDHGEEWSTNIIFTCSNNTVSADHPFGEPRHMSPDEAGSRVTFEFPTVLACKETYETETVTEPDSCQLYHSGINQYIDISPLVKQTPYIIEVTINTLLLFYFIII